MRKNSSHTRQRRVVLPNDTHDVFVPPRLENDPLNESDRQAQAAKKDALRRRKARQAARLKKKRARQKQIWARRRRIACLLTVVGVFVLWLFLRLAPVPFGTIIVDGNEKMSFEDVYRACGAYSYVNVIQLSTDDVEERLKKDLRIADATVTRAQVVTFLWRANGQPAAGNSGFVDVSSNAYYAKAVDWTFANGITTGMDYGAFGPDTACTRAQIVTFLYRAR